MTWRQKRSSSCSFLEIQGASLNPGVQLFGVTRPEIMFCSNRQGRENSQCGEGRGKVQGRKEKRGRELQVYKCVTLLAYQRRERNYLDLGWETQREFWVKLNCEVESSVLKGRHYSLLVCVAIGEESLPRPKGAVFQEHSQRSDATSCGWQWVPEVTEQADEPDLFSFIDTVLRKFSSI